MFFLLSLFKFSLLKTDHAKNYKTECAQTGDLLVYWNEKMTVYKSEMNKCTNLHEVCRFLF